MNNIELVPYYVADVSGGKDSLRMAGEIVKHPELFKLDAFVHFELEIDYPFVANVCDEYQKIADTLGIPFYRIKPRKTWDELYQKYGMPTRIVRWCNSMYKMDCVKQFNDWQKTLGRKVIHYIGFCADETRRFKDDDNIYPLAILNIKEDEILKEARKLTIFDDYYKICDRQGCMMCPAISRKEMAYLKIKHPEVYERFIAGIREWETTYNKTYFNSTQNLDNVLNLINNKWVPKVLAELNEESEVKND